MAHTQLYVIARRDSDQIRTALGGTKADTVILQHHFLLIAVTTFNQAANPLSALKPAFLDYKITDGKGISWRELRITCACR